MKRILALILAASFVLPLFSCGDESNDTSQSDGSGMMYNTSLLNNPESLDPQYACDEASNTVIANLYSGLMKFADDGTAICCNAESYSISEDGLTYTFNLRSDNYWFFDENDDDTVDDDECFPVTAEDYVFALQRVLDPEMQSPYSEYFTCIKGGEAAANDTSSADSIGVYAADSSTLVIQLEYPSADFINLMATPAAYPCNEEFFLSTKGRYGLDDDSVMSNGAFFVRQWFYDAYGSNNILYMKKNSANSTDENRVYPSFLSFTIEKSASDIREMFLDAEIDCFTTLNKNSFEKKKYTIESQQSITLGLIFNSSDKICSNESFKKALCYSINRQSLSDEADDDASAAYGIIPPAVNLLGRSYRDLSADTAFDTYDADKAAELCSTAKSELNAESFGTITMLVISGTVDSSLVHVLSREWQDALGFYVSIEELSEEDFYSRLEDGDYQLALYPVKGLYNSGISVLEQVAGDEYIQLSDSANAAVAELKKCTDASELVEEFTAAEKMIIDEMAYVPVFYKNSYLVMESENEDIVYDSFSGAVNFRNAKHFD